VDKTPGDVAAVLNYAEVMKACGREFVIAYCAERESGPHVNVRANCWRVLFLLTSRVY